MKIPKPSDDDRARFRSLVPEDPRVEVKPMFGNLGAFMNGNMFMGLFRARGGAEAAGGGGPSGGGVRRRPVRSRGAPDDGLRQPFGRHRGRPGQTACRPVARIRGRAPGQKPKKPKKAPPGSTRYPRSRKSVAAVRVMSRSASGRRALPAT